MSSAVLLQPRPAPLGGALPRAWRPLRSVPVWAVSVVALGSGVMNLLSVLGPVLPGSPAILRDLFPLEFLRLSRFLVLLIGFALIVSSANLYRRKRRAWQVAMILSILSFVFNLTRSLNVAEAALSLILAGVLWRTRRRFRVKSSAPDVRWALTRLGVAAGFALAYGVWGFWILDPKDFGIDFTLADSIRQTLLFFSLLHRPEIAAHTRHGAWFLESLYVIVITAYAYAGLALFRPVTYRLRIVPQDRALAAQILKRHGRSAMDYFKVWHDKSYFFSPTRESFIAYKVAGNFAIALGDPVGPPEQAEAVITSFERYCRDNDWRVAFHQSTQTLATACQKAGWRKLKIGDDAVVELAKFSLEGKSMKTMRSRVHQLEKLGVGFRVYDPPVAELVLKEAQRVSDEWLHISGRRERSFTVGAFEPEYMRNTRLAVAVDQQGKMLAFVNCVPSYVPGGATIDMMRRRQEAPNGIMDYLFVRVLELAKREGYQTFSLGMAPMAGFQEREEASMEERAVHTFFSHLNFLFSYQGLRSYKAKFATRWEPRYEMYRNVLDLPRLALALAKASEYKG